MGNSSAIARLGVPLTIGSDNALPTAFRLFVAGWNDTEHGRFLFDADAAAAVMASYRQWGVDLAIDLEHQMLGGASPDPTARDARGWCKLELRPDGSLWATDVRWTPDGAERLAQRRQRYISPAFTFDTETQRVTKLLNVAIVAMPATHHTPALIAASTRGTGMDQNAVKQALDALIAGDSEKCAELLKGMIAAAAADPAADPDATTEDAPPPVGDGGADEATESAAPAVPAADAPAADPKKDDEKKAAMAAASVIVRLSGRATVVEALEEVEAWRKSHVELETERQKLASDRAALEGAERRKLCVELITLGAEFPATVWADDKASALKPRWQAMPIAELRAHAADQRAARKGTTPDKNAKKTPPSGADKTFETPYGTVTLSAHELTLCEQAKAEPKVYAANKAFLATGNR